MTVKILVVDDEPDLEPLMLQRFRRQIRDGEMRFVFARDGKEALSKLEDDPEIELVLSDINMPVMDGLALLAALNEMPRLLKTVMVSAYNDMLNIRIAMNRGAYDFVTKPIDFDDLETTVRKTFRELDTLREARKTRVQLDEIHAELAVAAAIQQSLLPLPLGEAVASTWRRGCSRRAMSAAISTIIFTLATSTSVSSWAMWRGREFPPPCLWPWPAPCSAPRLFRARPRINVYPLLTGYCFRRAPRRPT